MPSLRLKGRGSEAKCGSPSLRPKEFALVAAGVASSEGERDPWRAAAAPPPPPTAPAPPAVSSASPSERVAVALAWSPCANRIPYRKVGCSCPFIRCDATSSTNRSCASEGGGRRRAARASSRGDEAIEREGDDGDDDEDEGVSDDEDEDDEDADVVAPCAAASSAMEAPMVDMEGVKVAEESMKMRCA